MKFELFPGSVFVFDDKRPTMFVLAEMKDTVRIMPHIFHINFTEATIDALNKKFANKVSMLFLLIIIIRLFACLFFSPSMQFAFTTVKSSLVWCAPSVNSDITSFCDCKHHQMSPFFKKKINRQPTFNIFLHLLMLKNYHYNCR